MLIFEYYCGQLDRMFTDRDTSDVERMCWHLDNPGLSSMWEYFTEDHRPIVAWELNGIIHGLKGEQML